MSTVMTPEEFQSWSQHLQLSKETEALITTIRESPPVRRVRGRAKDGQRLEFEYSTATSFQPWRIDDEAIVERNIQNL